MRDTTLAFGNGDSAISEETTFKFLPAHANGYGQIVTISCLSMYVKYGNQLIIDN